MSFLKEFWEFLKVRKKYWLIPIIIVLVVFGGLIILSQGSAMICNCNLYLYNFLELNIFSMKFLIKINKLIVKFSNILT